MSSFFGLEIRSKEEKEQDLADFTQRIFPYGEAQKNYIAQLLHGLFPGEDRQCLLVYYISIKDEMTKRTAKSFEAAAQSQMRTPMVRITPELLSVVKSLITADQNITETLDYPSIQELKEQFIKYT